MPPKMRPSISTLYCGECLVIQLKMYVMQYVTLALFRPLQEGIVNNINQMLQDHWSSRI
jgi:hypothetical protein